MDGLSCIASVVAVIQLTELVLKTAHDRLGLGPSRFDKGSLQDILQKLYALNGTLSSLKIHLEINEADQARLLALKNLNDPLDRCKDALELIKNWLESSSFLGRHIVGKRFDKKYDQAVKVLEESQRLMQLCLLSDQQTIVSAVEQYLRVMIEDVQDIQSTLNDNGKRIMDLEQSFQRKAKEIRTGTEKVGKQLSKLEREEYIRSLPYAEGAALDSNLRQISGCFPNTRVSIIKNIESWNQDVTGKPIFWLNGMAGAGKSTIAHTVASRLHNAGALAASRNTADTGVALSDLCHVPAFKRCDTTESYTTVVTHIISNDVPRRRLTHHKLIGIVADLHGPRAKHRQCRACVPLRLSGFLLT